MSDPAPGQAAAPAGFLQDAKGDFSSKRMAAAFALVNLAGLTWVSALSAHQAPEAALYLWGSIALGALGLTVPEWFSPKKG